MVTSYYFSISSSLLQKFLGRIKMEIKLMQAWSKLNELRAISLWPARRKDASPILAELIFLPLLNHTRLAFHSYYQAAMHQFLVLAVVHLPSRLVLSVSFILTSPWSDGKTPTAGAWLTQVDLLGRSWKEIMRLCKTATGTKIRGFLQQVMSVCDRPSPFSYIQNQ